MEDCEKTADEATGFNTSKFQEKVQQKFYKDHENQSESSKEDEKEIEDNSGILIDNPELLQAKLERNKKEYQLKKTEYDNLIKKIEGIVKRLGHVIDVLEELSLKERQSEFEKERAFIKEELEKLEKIEQEIKQNLEKCESVKRKRPKYKSDVDESNQKSEQISVELLLAENQPINNTVLYVGTFFTDLNSYDFEQVVSFLLQEQTTTVTVKSQITTEHGETRLIEAPKEKALTEIWKESQKDKVLHNCYLSAVYLDDSSQIIDFYIPNLRENLKKYFQEELPFYLSEKFELARLLLLSPSVQVAIKAIYLSVDMAISSPAAYGENWLFEIIVGLPETANLNLDNDGEDEQKLNRLIADITGGKRRAFVLDRVSSLIAQMLDYSQLQGVVKNLFEQLISVRRYSSVLAIIKRLHSTAQFDELYWIKQLLERGDARTRSEAYKLLYSLLAQSNSKIYEFLDTIKTWLPQPNCPPEKYSEANKCALEILVYYCYETTDKIELNDYGCWQSKYPLFAPLYQDISIESKLELLVTWLFHPGLKYVIDEDINTIQLIGFLLASWFIILWGLEKKEPQKEVTEVADILIRQIIVHTTRSQQKELLEFWNELADSFLAEANAYEENGDYKSSKLYFRRRALVRQLRKQFKAAQKNN
jgi:hypothetical protein